MAIVLMDNSVAVTAKVFYCKPKNAKCKVVTNILILAGSQTIAEGQFGGRFSEVEALSEFRKARQRFRLINPGYDNAKLLGLV